MDDLDALFAAAARARERAYAPYSGFRVGAAVRGASGAIHVGCNVENAAFPVGLCAEGAAIAAMVAGGERLIRDIAVVGGRDPTEEGEGACPPCGACRQRIGEFADRLTRVHVRDADGALRASTLDKLLPDGFGPRTLAPIRGEGVR